MTSQSPSQMLGGPVRLLRCPPTVAGHLVATGRQRFADLPRLWSQTPRRALAPRGCPASRFAVSCRCLLLAHHHAYDPGIPENRSTTRVPPGQSRFSSRPPRSRVLSTYSAPPVVGMISGHHRMTRGRYTPDRPGHPGHSGIRKTGPPGNPSPGSARAAGWQPASSPGPVPSGRPGARAPTPSSRSTGRTCRLRGMLTPASG